LRQTIVFMTLIGMELCWLYAVLNAINKSVSDVLYIPLLIMTLLISLAISWSLRFTHWPKPVLTALTWIIWPVIMLLMIKIQLFPKAALFDSEWLYSIPRAFSQIFYSFEPALLIILSTAGLWWLGRRLAYLHKNFSEALTEFQFGIIVLVITFFCIYELELDQSSSLPVLLSFFSLALVGISVSHSQNSTWFNSNQRGQWSGVLVLCITLILLAGLLISLIVTPDLIQFFINTVKWVWGIIEKVLTFIANLFPSEPTAPPYPLPVMPGMDTQQDTVFTIPEGLRQAAKLVYLIFISAFLIFVIYRVSSDIMKWLRRRASMSGGEIESLKGVFWADVIGWIKRILNKVFGIRFRSGLKRESGNIPTGAVSIRQLYVQILNWGAKKGFARQKDQTPLEYGNMLNSAISEGQSDLDLITEQYMAARYGFIMPEEDKLEQVKKIWGKLKKVKFSKN
jgi:hypothetical protein